MVTNEMKADVNWEEKHDLNLLYSLTSVSLLLLPIPTNILCYFQAIVGYRDNKKQSVYALNELTV